MDALLSIFRMDLLTEEVFFVSLRNCQFYQDLEVAMGSQISASIANLIIEH